MARTKNNTAIGETKVDEVVVEKEVTEDAGGVEIPANVEKLMRLYPQYKSFYATSTGFVHPIGAPQYLVKTATLYENKYYKSQTIV